MTIINNNHNLNYVNYPNNSMIIFPNLQINNKSKIIEN